MSGGWSESNAFGISVDNIATHWCLSLASNNWAYMYLSSFLLQYPAILTSHLVNNPYFLFKPSECAFLFKFSFHSFSFLKYVQSLSNSVSWKIFYFLALSLCTSVYKNLQKNHQLHDMVFGYENKVKFLIYCKDVWFEKCLQLKVVPILKITNASSHNTHYHFNCGKRRLHHILELQNIGYSSYYFLFGVV